MVGAVATQEEHERVENEIADQLEGNDLEGYKNDTTPSGTLEYHARWFDLGTKVDLYEAQEVGEFNLTGAYGITEKKSLDHTMHHFWMEFIVSGGYL